MKIAFSLPGLSYQGALIMTHLMSRSGPPGRRGPQRDIK